MLHGNYTLGNATKVNNCGLLLYIYYTSSLSCGPKYNYNVISMRYEYIKKRSNINELYYSTGVICILIYTLKVTELLSCFTCDAISINIYNILFKI